MKRHMRIHQSPNYKAGEFQNSSPTPTFAEGYNIWGVLRKQLFERNPHRRPAGPIPAIKTDLSHLPPDSNLLVWFGHSSFYLQVGGKRILIDPVFSHNASPIPGTVRPFDGTTIYSAGDIPEIDVLLISHDHYDHLDYATVTALQSKVHMVICGLGVGAHFQRWGYPPGKIVEMNWNGSISVGEDCTIHSLPARHQSGRGFKKNQSLWLSYLIQIPALKIYYSGDGGYDKHFAAIGEKFGPIDLALIENGQYDKAWHYIHMLPEETMQAARDVRARRFMPVHNSKFSLAKHSWDAPLEAISRLNETYHIPLVTPVIGEIVKLDDDTQTFRQWWKDVIAKNDPL